MIAEVFGRGFANQVGLYIPSTTHVSEQLDSGAADGLVENALRFLSTLFGGATALPARGAWLAEGGTLIVEHVTLVYSYAPKLTRAQLRAVKRYALALKVQYRQDTVAIEINGKLYIL